jgi:hypothetical protein
VAEEERDWREREEEEEWREREEREREEREGHHDDEDKVYREREAKEWNANFERDQKMADMEIEAKKIELERMRSKHRGHGPNMGGILAIFLIGCFVVNVLMAIWVYTDIRLRDTGSGIWIVVVLLAGIPGAIAYAVVRLGDIRMANTGTTRSRKS